MLTEADLARYKKYADNVAALLGALRRQRQLTQAQLAAMTGGKVSQKALANYEISHRPLRIHVLESILEALGEDTREFLLLAELVGSSAHNVTSIRIESLLINGDPEFEKLRRWWITGHPEATRPSDEVIYLNKDILTTLATLLGLTVEELVLLLKAKRLLSRTSQ